MQQTNKPEESIININSRREMTVTGINTICGFGEDYVTLDTECGRLEIDGEGMKIEELNREEGKVYIKGKISALYYSEIKPKSSLFKRMKK